MADDDPQQPKEHERDDAAARAGDLARMAQEHEDATWGDTDVSRAVVPGIISGDVGPKGKVAAQLRDVTRGERARRDDVPRGTVARGGPLLVLVPMLAIAAIVIIVVAIIFWVAS